MRSLSVTLVSLALACSVSEPGGAGESESSGGETGEGLDEERLDRSEPGACGYPGPGPLGYGVELGQRVANFSLRDCAFEEVAFDGFFCPREDDYGDYNRAIVLTIGAGWCAPCVEETSELMPTIYDPLHDQGVEIVQVLFEDGAAQPPTTSFCSTWADESFDPPLAFPVLIDQTFAWTGGVLEDTQGGVPLTLVLDANANVRWVSAGVYDPSLVDHVMEVLASPYGE